MPERPPDRELHAQRLERHARVLRYVVLAQIPAAALAALDLVTGWIFDDVGVDLTLLVLFGGTWYCVHLIRGFARRVRQGELAERPTRRAWAGSAVSAGVSLAASFVVGYLMGGLAVAAILTAVNVLLTAAFLLLGLRRRAGTGP